MEVLKFIFILFEVLVLFNLLIFVHEWGHYLAARWRGLKIERFSIWFGKPIWKKEINGVEFCLGCIPAGGYVSLPQMAPMEMLEGQTETPQEQLPAISALDKIIVAFAGPLFSFLLAVAFALLVWVVGRPVSESEATTTIGYVVEDGPAAQAGLEPGDKILKIDGGSVKKFRGMGDSIQWRVVRSEGEFIDLEFERNGQVQQVKVKPRLPETSAWERKSLKEIGVLPAQSLIIGEVFPNSPADRCGLKVRDEIQAVDGNSFPHYILASLYIKDHADQELNLSMRRGEKVFEVGVKPEKPVEPPDGEPAIGIRWADGGVMGLVHPGPWEQVVASVNAMVQTFGALLSPKSDISAQHLGGAIKIINVYYLLFRSDQGWRLVLWFSVLMNVNLALLNLLPIPVLDGGHITLAVVEGIRRKPVSLRFLQIVQTACAALLIGFMLYIAFYDVQDLRQDRPEDPAVPQFAPQAPSSSRSE